MAEKKPTETPETTAESQEKKAPPGLLLRSILLEEEHPEEKLLYGFKGGVIGFVDHDGKLYITPGTRIKIDLLESCGFRNRRPQIEVPYSDGSVKSKRWLRKELPHQEIMRSVEENRMPKVDGKVLGGILQANRAGLGVLEPEFLKRCARSEEKFFYYVGLAASFHGILSFTDWDVMTWVTPYSDEKRRTLEERGYTFVESMIKVPYALDNKDNRSWLAAHIPLDEWERTETEVRQARAAERMEKARKKIEELGLKELPPELLQACTAVEEKLPGNMGLAGAHNGIIGFTDPDGTTWLTPATSAKVEMLKSLGYQFMGSAIKVPHSLKTKEDIAWLQANIPPAEWDNAHEANQAEQRRREEEMAEKLQRSLELKDLTVDLLDRSIRSDVKQPNFAGHYFVRNDILGYVCPDTFVYITPAAGSKVKLLKEANYHAAPTGFPVPHSDNSPADMEFILRHLTQAEVDSCRQERETEQRKEKDQSLKRILEARKLQELNREFLGRCARTEQSEIELIGHYCSRGGVTTFIHTDGFYWVTPFTPEKEQILKEAGYSPPERLIRVPYGSETEQDRTWLEQNLPKGELERCRKEQDALEEQRRKKELQTLREKKQISEELPQDLASRSAQTEESLPAQIGEYMIQGNWLAFITPDGRLWITPLTSAKVELLKKDRYQPTAHRFPIAHASEKPEDQQWREQHLPNGELERSRKENEVDADSHLDTQARELATRRTLQALTPEFLARSADAGKAGPQMVGRYLEKNQFLYVVTPDRVLHITPVTPDKLKTLAVANYHFPEKLEPLNHFSDTESDLEWIRKNLPEGELEKCFKERQDLENAKLDGKVAQNIEKFKLKPVPENIAKRGADSGQKDAKDVGRLGMFRGVLAWVGPDERVFVSWYTPEKQEAMEECGYKLEGYMPIKVPFAMADKKQRRWLLDNLPKPNDEEQISVDENSENV